MSMLKILKYPDPSLKIIAKSINKFNNSMKKIMKNMKDTMYNSSGMGLAATQVNMHKKMMIMDIFKKKKKLLIFINPNIIWKSKKKMFNKEGCLSFPGIYKKILSFNKIKMKFQNIKGKNFKFKINGILSFCMQHEMDHLNGKLFMN